MYSPHGTLETCDPLDARQFHVAVKRLADSLSYGTDHSPFRGSGLDYVQSRLYQDGDSIKSIDWRVTARTGTPHVKEYEAPKRMPVYLFIDTSASMTIGSQRLTKYAWAVQIAGGLAFTCLDRVSPVGVVGVGERPVRVSPSLSRVQVMQWMHELRHFRYDESTTLALRLTELSASLPHRALLVVLSDLQSPEALPVLRLVAQRHDVMALQLRDPAEDPLRGVGFFRAGEAESDHSFLPHSRQPLNDQDALVSDLRRGGVDHLLLRIDQPIIAPLRHFLQSRGGLARMAR
jgi:uncharacterized protein (DUF58 family)